MYSNEEAIAAAKNLVEFCSSQFCPDCVFNKGHCILGGLGITPHAWNEGNQLINLVTLPEVNTMTGSEETETKATLSPIVSNS